MLLDYALLAIIDLATALGLSAIVTIIGALQ